MKKIGFLIAISLLLVCFSCKKDQIDFDSGQIIITEIESPLLSNDNDTISAVFHGRYSYSGNMHRLFLLMGLKDDVSDGKPYTAEMSGNSFTIVADSMLIDTVYYYRYVVCRYSDEFGEDMEWQDSIKVLSTRGLALPKVSTGAVENIKRTSAICGGIVIDEGGQALIECGICWSKHSRPTIDDNHRAAIDLGLGEYRISIDSLEPATTYYVRAYAKNGIGIWYDTTSITFNTRDFTVITHTPSVTGITAWLGASVYLDFEGPVILDRVGFLWGVTPQTENADPWGSFPNGYAPSGVGFFRYLYNLDYETTYYVKAYAVDCRSEDTVYGEIESFTTLSAPPTGTINGLFSVSENEKVYFSKGNLQYQASTNTWRFAENQWDFVGGTYYSGAFIGNVNGSSNNDISSSYSGWIDLFGWGTSGYEHGAVCYQPWSVSRDIADYHVYGCPTCNLFDESGKADWGYNAISNGGITEHTWRTLSKDEWKYVFKQRDTPSGTRYAKAKVNAVNGIVILPDNWNNNLYSLHDTNNTNASFETNIIPLSDWTEKLESNGAVFLPAGGERWDIQVHNAGAYGLYWASSNRGGGFVNEISFSDSYFNPDYFGYLFYGRSVRLVRSSDD